MIHIESVNAPNEIKSGLLLLSKDMIEDWGHIWTGCPRILLECQMVFSDNLLIIKYWQFGASPGSLLKCKV